MHYNNQIFEYGLITLLLSYCRQTRGFHQNSKISVNQHCHHALSFSACVKRDLSGNGKSAFIDKLNPTDNGEYDLSSPRIWMEYLESNEGLAGVYTVMRVDATYYIDSSSRCCPIHTFWDKEFHVHRLSSSFAHIFAKNITRKAIADATIDSEVVISGLIRQIQQELWKANEAAVDGVKILMLTLLWTPSLEAETGPILVRGHVCSPGTLSQPQLYDPIPIKAVIALPDIRDSNRSKHGNENTCVSLRNLPSRFNNNPQAKISSWCKKRRPLEDLFKQSDIGEVLLVRKCDEFNWEILEGLTSNIFVLYSDGTLRTCFHGVLKGYAQYIVQKAASRCNLVISNLPITLQDALDGCWTEVFITSAIRIITPLTEILIPNYERFDVYQTSDVISLTSLWNATEQNRLWKVLYSEILQSRLSIPAQSSFD